LNEETTASSSPDEPARRVGRIAQGATLLVRELLATEDADVLFVVRSDDAQVLFYPDFDQIVLLRAPRDVMVQRLASRSNNPFGKSSEELARILADLETFEPSMRRAATHEIDTSKSIDHVIEQIISLVRQPPPA
jgi:broad-specificity NMP kinase